ncbi:MAG: hypothetical protein PWQ67_1480 [Clostridia bacterium]|jgi:hypothetical protein|nr:hypothetical protein [Clostridiales bacterium]MDK2934252.1 hypothetical protein [Clostridiales bacterium]MDN5323026.1 hypothetical protein [Clostridia bacterium]
MCLILSDIYTFCDFIIIQVDLIIFVSYLPIFCLIDV